MRFSSKVFHPPRMRRAMPACRLPWVCFWVLDRWVLNRWVPIPALSHLLPTHPASQPAPGALRGGGAQGLPWQQGDAQPCSGLQRGNPAAASRGRRAHGFRGDGAGGIAAGEVPAEDRAPAVFAAAPAMGFGFAPCRWGARASSLGAARWVLPQGKLDLSWAGSCPASQSGTRHRGDAAPRAGISRLVPKARVDAWQSWSLGPAQPLLLFLFFFF